MKQKYTKPTLLMESFTLSQSIAHNCGENLDFNKATHSDKGSCGWDLGYDAGHGEGADILFLSEACSLRTDYFAGVCYNNPDGGFNVFNS